MADDPTKDEQERRYRERDEDAMDGVVIMSGDQVAWAGPQAVLGQQQEDEDDEGEGEDGEEFVATGEDYTPPDETSGEE